MHDIHQVKKEFIKSSRFETKMPKTYSKKFVEQPLLKSEYIHENNEAQLNLTRKIISSINLRNYYVTHLFNLHKINLNDLKNSRKSLLKVMAAFFFVKSRFPDQFHVLNFWYQNSLHHMKAYNYNNLNVNHQYGSSNMNYPSHRYPYMNEVSSSKCLRPYNCRCMSPHFKNQVLEEANIARLQDNNLIYNQRFTNRKKHRFFEEKPLSCSPCQYSHGERVLASNINRGKHNYCFSRPYQNLHSGRAYFGNSSSSCDECQCIENSDYYNSSQNPATARYSSVSFI